MNLTLFGAFAGGVLTLLSPCSAMLLPAFFSYAFTSPTQLLARTGVFFLGLITTLVPIGVLAGSIGAWVNEHRSTVVDVAAWLVIAFGVLMLLGVRVPLPANGASSTTPGADTDTTSVASVYLLGTVYGLAGMCAGPLLGAALTVAALNASAAYGGLILVVFAAGMVVPLTLLALAWDRMPWAKRLATPRGVRIGSWSNTWTGIVGGALTIAVGALLLLTDGTASIAGALTTDQQFRLERWVTRWSRDVPDVAFVAAAGALLGGIWLLHRRVRAQHATIGEA